MKHVSSQSALFLSLAHKLSATAWQLRRHHDVKLTLLCGSDGVSRLHSHLDIIPVDEATTGADIPHTLSVPIKGAKWRANAKELSRTCTCMCTYS